MVANVSSPRACVRTPSQIVRVTSAAGQLTIRPSRSDSCASAASSGSTPITRASGQSALTAVATPEMRPPPPTQTTTVATAGRSCGDLEADRALAGDDPRVVEGRDVLERASVADLRRHALALVARVGAAHDLGAVGGGARDLDGRGVLGHHDRGRDAEQRSGGGDALGVVAARVGDDAALDRLERGRGERVEGAAELERARALQALGLDVDLAVERQPEQRRSHGDALEPLGSGLDVRERDREGARRSRDAILELGSEPAQSRTLLRVSTDEQSRSSCTSSRTRRARQRRASSSRSRRSSRSRSSRRSGIRASNRSTTCSSPSRPPAAVRR